MKRYLAGAIGGLLATVPMTLTMELLHRRLAREERYPLPPREITQDIVQRTGHEKDLDEEQLARLSLLGHFGYGAVTGALYPLTRQHIDHPLVYGSGYGIAVWAASYFGWVPALDILAPPNRHPVNRRRLMIVAHVVWGASTVWIGERLARSSAFSRPDDHSANSASTLHTSPQRSGV